MNEDGDPPATKPLDTSSPFTRQQAHEAKISDSRLRGPGFVLLHRGVYVSATASIDLPMRVRAALLTQVDDAVLVGLTAAGLLGLPVPESPIVHVGVTESADRRPRPGISSVVDTRRAAMSAVDGIDVTTGTTLFLQLAADLSLVELVVVGDAMVRRRMVTIDTLKRACSNATCKGVVMARRATGLVRERVDSPMETRLRLLLVLAGFPEPLVNPTIDKRYRADLCWAAQKLILEYQGQQHRTDLDQWDHDIERGEYLEQHGWLVAEVVARDIFQRPDRLLERVYDLWRSRGGKPFKRREEWRAHFPVKADRANLAG